MHMLPHRWVWLICIQAASDVIEMGYHRFLLQLIIFSPCSLEQQRDEVTIPTAVYSASLHPDRSVFICGGEDFKMYKYDYSTNVELESFKGHFGPVHCVRFSPDGELYASGSEDGTLRLWQTTVGKTYGLWKCVDASSNEIINTPAKPEATAQVLLFFSSSSSSTTTSLVLQ